MKRRELLGGNQVLRLACGVKKKNILPLHFQSIKIFDGPGRVAGDNKVRPGKGYFN